MNVLVTGRAGFVGSHLVEGLVRSGHGVEESERAPSRRLELSDATHQRVEPQP